MSVHSEKSLPVERTDFRTTDPEVARAAIGEMYIGYRPKVSGSTEDFAFEVSRTSAGDLHTDRLVYSMDLAAACDPFDYLLFIFPTAGNITMTWGDQENRLGVGDAGMYPVGVPLDVSLSPLCADFLSLPLEAAEAAAAEQDDVGDLRFTGVTPVSAAMDRFWRATVGFVTHQMEAPDSPLSEPLLRAETRALLGAAVLRTFPNTTMTADYRSRTGWAGPVALRHAVAFIDAHAGRPITLNDMAGAAATSPRALTNAFARHYDTSPLDYLRRVRLENAHRDLQSADPAETTVAAVAARWGFAEPGKFSAAHQEAYGEAPGHTLST
jgi:AraC-like DNA-binding protein